MQPLRPLCLVSCLAAAGFAAAQLSGPELTIQGALATLRGNSALVFELTGTRQLARQSHIINTNVYWAVEADGARVLDKVEVSQWVDGEQVATIVGDGTTLWSYSFLKNEYSAVTYGTYAGPEPANYTNSLLNALESMSSGQSAYATRLLRQTYSGLAAGYVSWSPGNTPTESGGPNLKIVDYAPTTSDDKKIDFQVSIDTNGTPSLDQVSFDEAISQGALVRRLTWDLKVYPGTLLVAPSGFKFNPPPGARPITGMIRKID